MRAQLRGYRRQLVLFGEKETIRKRAVVSRKRAVFYLTCVVCLTVTRKIGKEKVYVVEKK